MSKRRGNCYYASEALYHILGGSGGAWEPFMLKLDGGETHWFLVNKDSREILDPSRRQFARRPDYNKAKRRAFLTRHPSKGASRVMEVLTWQ